MITWDATLSVGVEQFVREHLAQDKWTAKTEERWRYTMRNLSEFMGDCALGDVTRDDCMRFFERLRRMPSNASKQATLNGMTFNDLTDPAANHGFPVLSSGTVNDHMTRLSGFFKWARSVYGLPMNPAENISIANVTSDGREAFTDSDLLSIFTEESWKQRKFKHSYYYWLPLLAFYTGARINELCQLRPADFITVSGVDVISIATVDDEKAKAKNNNARRRVPIHDELKRLGLLRWVESLRAQGKERIFWTLLEGRDGHGEHASKWFGRFTKRINVYVKQRKVFHSFRVGFISQLMNLGKPQPLIAAVVGHEIGSVTGDTYWKDRDAGALLDMVNLIKMSGHLIAIIPTVEEVSFGEGNP
jgi:integrase